jgi:hypothetical protein
MFMASRMQLTVMVIRPSMNNTIKPIFFRLSSVFKVLKSGIGKRNTAGASAKEFGLKDGNLTNQLGRELKRLVG